MYNTEAINAGIIGGAGYTGGELIRLLLHHPHVRIAYIVSRTYAGKQVHEIHPDTTGDVHMKFSGKPGDGADVVFLCLQHGESRKCLEENPMLYKSKIIDLSRDFRWNQKGNFVYGLPELNRPMIQKAGLIANPGCFATAMQLGLLPLASLGYLPSQVNITATTGATGAGQTLSATTHFNWRHGNLSVYNLFDHPHVTEAELGLKQLQKDVDGCLHFIPQRGSFTRGILSIASFTCDKTEKQVRKIYEEYYEDHPFTHCIDNADIKQVVNTNKCFIQLVKKGNRLAVITVIDNLLKGAAGQAVQNMNLSFGFDETAGLRLKANVF